MNTPREILLQRHRAVEPRLDEIRRNVIAQMEQSPVTPVEGLPVRVVLTLWRELLWPARRAWVGLGVAWILIVAVNFYVAGPDQVAGRKFTSPSLATLLALREQERQFSELGEPSERREADRPKPSAPRPRSQARFELLIG